MSSGTVMFVLDRLMREGKVGLKSGEGFYDWRERDTLGYRRDVMARMLAQLQHVGLARQPVE